MRLDYSRSAFFVHRVLEPDAAKLTTQVSFKETDEVFQRLREIAARQRRPDAFVARAIFRIGLDALEKAIQGGLVS